MKLSNFRSWCLHSHCSRQHFRCVDSIHFEGNRRASADGHSMKSLDFPNSLGWTRTKNWNCLRPQVPLFCIQPSKWNNSAYSVKL